MLKQEYLPHQDTACPNTELNASSHFQFRETGDEHEIHFWNEFSTRWFENLLDIVWSTNAKQLSVCNLNVRYEVIDIASKH